MLYFLNLFASSSIIFSKSATLFFKNIKISSVSHCCRVIFQIHLGPLLLSSPSHALKHFVNQSTDANDSFLSFFWRKFIKFQCIRYILLNWVHKFCLVDNIIFFFQVFVEILLGVFLSQLNHRIYLYGLCFVLFFLLDIRFLLRVVVSPISLS